MMDAYSLANAWEAAEDIYQAIQRFMRQPNELPDDQITILIAEMRCIYLQMIYAECQPERTD